MGGPLPEAPLEVRSVTVMTGRLVCEVRVAQDHRRTDGALAAFVAERFPDLPHHACVNDAGPTFGAVMARTSLPHMLEHLSIQLQLQQAAPGDERTFTGTTEWLDEDQGLARIQLSFADDMAALRAFNEAVMFLNDAVLTCRP